MEQRRRIVLYGNSVILGSVGASLRNLTNLEVISLAVPLPQKSELTAMAADVIFFDLEATRSEVFFPLLEKCPGLLLVGVSPDSNLVRLWSGRQLCELSTRDVLQIIDEQFNGSSVL